LRKIIHYIVEKGKVTAIYGLSSQGDGVKSIIISYTE